MRIRKVKYYSQNGEDYVLWEFFDYKRKGFFVDIGAFDGRHLSNTYSFEEKGWKGICVEAHPDYFPLLKENRSNSLCLHYACVGERNRGYVDFHVEKMGLLSSILDTRDYNEDVKSRYAKRGLPFEGFNSVSVPAATIDELLERHSGDKVKLDFISIDVEGYEIEVMKGFDTGKYSPRIIIIEANTELARDEIIDYIANKEGYHFAGRLVENLFFVREEIDLERIRKIEIDCRIEKQTHPLGEAYSTEEYLAGKIINETGQNRLIWETALK